MTDELPRRRSVFSRMSKGTRVFLTFSIAVFAIAAAVIAAFVVALVWNHADTALALTMLALMCVVGLVGQLTLLGWARARRDMLGLTRERTRDAIRKANKPKT